MDISTPLTAKKGCGVYPHQAKQKLKKWLFITLFSIGAMVNTAQAATAIMEIKVKIVVNCEKHPNHKQCK